VIRMFKTYVQFLRSASILQCCGLALVSSLIWALMWALAGAFVYLAGSVFCILVLFRYVQTAWKCGLVAVLGTLTYYFAINASAALTGVLPGEIAVALVGAGAAEVMLVACGVLGTLKLGLRALLSTAAAGAVGGALIGVWADNMSTLYAGHALWQVLVCCALLDAQFRPTWNRITDPS